MMPAKTLGRLKPDGFCIIDGCLGAEVIASLIAQIEQTPAPRTSGSATRMKRGVVFARRNLLSLEFIRKFIATDAVRSLIEQVSPGSIAVRAILFDKTGEANWTVPWHQDRSIAVRERIDAQGFGPWSVKAGIVHVQPPLDLLRQMVTLRFSLDSCDPENGPLRVIPRTHERMSEASLASLAGNRRGEA